MEAQLGVTETQALCAALETVSPVSVRFNPYKVALSVADAQGVLTTVSEVWSYGPPGWGPVGIRRCIGFGRAVFGE